MTESAPTHSARTSLRVISLKKRRTAVAVLFASYLAAAALWHLGGSPHLVALKAASVAALLVSLAAFAVLFYRTGYWTWGSGSELGLDERQLLLRNRAYVWSYTVFVCSVFVSMLYYHIASDAGFWLPDRRLDWEWVYYGVTVFGLSLPSILLAVFDRPLPDEE